MAGYQADNRVRGGPFDLNDEDLSPDEWMARRNAQVAQRGRAEVAGRQAWVDSIRTGQSVNASQPGHLTAIGMHALSGQPARTSLSHGYNPNEPRDEHGRWDPDPPLERPGKRPLRPDAGTPKRNPEDDDERYYLELKPNTKSGRAAAARAVKRYQSASGRKVRPVYYTPKDIK